jgi:serine/threonine-protein kinase
MIAVPDSPARFAERYRLTESLGKGGMGEVWRAYDERLNRYCAIKVLRQMEDPATAERFSREARTLASLRHPGVVTVYDYGVDSGRPYLVMELLPGPSLAELLRSSGPLEIDAVRLYGSQVAGALQAVHDAGVVHRDLKPANVVLDNTGSARLVDFGIALGATFEATLTEHGAIIGSAAYLAPEQATGGRANARSDLYSFGCLLMTLLTGKPPFTDDTPVDILGKHLSEPPPLCSSRRPEVPPDLDALVAELLAKRPEERPANCAEVARRLGGGRGTRPSPGPVPMPTRTFGGAAPPPDGPNGRSGVTAQLPPPPPPPSHAARPGAGNKRVLVGGLAAVIALGLAGAAWALTRSNDSGPAPVPLAPVVTETPTPTETPSPVETFAPPPTITSNPELSPPPLLPLPEDTPAPVVTPTPTPTPTGGLPIFPFPTTPNPEPTSTATSTPAPATQQVGDTSGGATTGQ